MQFVAKARYVRCSPFKMRSLADVVRGKDAHYALGWLKTCQLKKAVPLTKMIESAVANAKHSQSVEVVDLRVKEIRVDQGPVYRYFKPGAMGRSTVLRKRSSHMSVILESINKKEV